MIEVRNLTKRFGPVLAVDDLTFSVAPGGVTGFLGPNGSGKTTTLRMILGLVRPTAGTATIDGLPYVGLPGGTVGAVLDGVNAHPRSTGRAHLGVYAAMAGLPRRRVGDVLAQLEMTDFADRPAGEYSTGMRQRLSLATALLGDPRVLLLDEPSNGLDPQGMAWLRELLRRLASDGRTILISSHVLSELEQVADHVVVINSGRLVTSGTVASLGGSVVLVKSPDAERLGALLGAPVADGMLRVTGRTAAEIADRAADAGLRIHELTPVRSSLEDVFLELTR
jgi:ABC-2 type transport system ATP-binding protein